MTIFAGDPGLLRRFRAGDRGALSEVYWFFVPRVESFLRRGLRLSGGASHASLRADTADLVQEVFVRAFSEPARRAYDGEREYGPLLVTIARNALVDHLRRGGREKSLDPSELERVSDSPDGEPDEGPWADSQTMAIVERFVARLPVRDHEVYVQRYRDGRSQSQAADALGLTRQRVRTIEERLRAGLARELSRARTAAHPAIGLRPPAPGPLGAYAHERKEDR